MLNHLQTSSRFIQRLHTKFQPNRLKNDVVKRRQTALSKGIKRRSKGVKRCCQTALTSSVDQRHSQTAFTNGIDKWHCLTALSNGIDKRHCQTAYVELFHFESLQQGLTKSVEDHQNYASFFFTFKMVGWSSNKLVLRVSMQ